MTSFQALGHFPLLSAPSGFHKVPLLPILPISYDSQACIHSPVLPSAPEIHISLLPEICGRGSNTHLKYSKQNTSETEFLISPKVNSTQLLKPKIKKSSFISLRYLFSTATHQPVLILHESTSQACLLLLSPYLCCRLEDLTTAKFAGRDRRTDVVYPFPIFIQFSFGRNYIGKSLFDFSSCILQVPTGAQKQLHVYTHEQQYSHPGAVTSQVCICTNVSTHFYTREEIHIC